VEELYLAHAATVFRFLVAMTRDADVVEQQTVRAALSVLPDTYRMVLVRADDLGMPHGEIAEESARIAGHLDGCRACGRLLDELAGTSPTPATTADQDPPAYDSRWIRRAVGRTMLSIAWRTALLLVVVWRQPSSPRHW